MPILLIILGLVLIILNYKALKKGDNSFGNMLEYKKNDISDLELEIGQMRKDTADSLTELQKEILKLKNIDIKSDNIIAENDEVEEKEENYNDNRESVINDINYKGKSERIKELLDMGLSDDEICEKLSLGKGEVLLVKGLYKK